MARQRIARPLPRLRAAAGWALAALVALPLLGAAPAPVQADGGWWGDLDKGLNVRLDDVITNPERFRGRMLTFTCVFHQAEREFNPLRTRFNAERYENVSVWPDGAEVWKREAFVADFPFLYIARQHAQRDLLVRQELYTRLEVTARIEAVVDGLPFLEATAVRVPGHKLGKRAMDAMLKGWTYAQTNTEESQTLAAQHYADALDAVPDLAPLYQARVRDLLGATLRKLGREAEAAAVLGPHAPDATPAPSGLLTPPLAPAMPPPVVQPMPTGDLPPIPRGGSLPGEEVGVPRPPAASGLEGSPDGDAPPTPRVVPPPYPRGTQPGPRAAPIVPPQPPAPPPLDGGMRPSLPGVPVDNLPVPPGAAPLRAPAPAPAAMPRPVDLPLPAPVPGQAPPRRSRLAGVK